MRKILMLAAVLATAAALAAPTSALAWHVEITCTQTHLVGTPSNLVWYQNGVQYSRLYVPSGWDKTVPTPAPPGYGKITVVGTGGNENFQATTYDACGQQPTPTPTPTPSPTPTPPPVTPPSPPAAPPATPPAPPAPPSPPPAQPKPKCVPYPKSRFRLIDSPDMSTLPHGKVTFRVKGPHIRWVRFHVDHRYAWTDRSRPFRMTVYLWQTGVFGPKLWGPHTIKANIRTKCGIVTLVKHEFNHDPPPASAARSSWG